MFTAANSMTTKNYDDDKNGDDTNNKRDKKMTKTKKNKKNTTRLSSNKRQQRRRNNNIAFLFPLLLQLLSCSILHHVINHHHHDGHHHRFTSLSSSSSVVVEAFVPQNNFHNNQQQNRRRRRHVDCRQQQRQQLQLQLNINRRDIFSQTIQTAAATTATASATSSQLFFWPGRNDNYNDRPLSRYVDYVHQNYTLAETKEDYINLVDNQRLICIGDVHGDLWALQDFLEISGVYDRQLDEWIGGNTIVVQCGDILDRGVEELACYTLLCKLSQQAIHTDGKVILLIGNHEAMNSMGLFQYAINDMEHEHKIGLAVDEELETPNWRIQYAKNQPSRWSSYEPGGLLATSLLANMKVAIRVGRTVCVHAGLRPSHLKDNGGIEGMNKQFRDWITLESDGEYDNKNFNIINNYNPIHYNHRGQYNDPIRQPYIDAEKRQTYYMESIPTFLKAGPGAVGPIWMRDYSYPHDQPPKDENGSTTRMIEETLLLLDCDRMIMGHTIQRQINCVLHGRAWRIDVGASRGCGSGTPEVLEIIHKNTDINTDFGFGIDSHNSNNNNQNKDQDQVSILTSKGRIPAHERFIDVTAVADFL